MYLNLKTLNNLDENRKKSESNTHSESVELKESETKQSNEEAISAVNREASKDADDIVDVNTSDNLKNVDKKSLSSKFMA
jgi:hypothetical protein